LPILPDFRLKPIATARDRIKAIQNALSACDQVIHAGGPDAGGQFGIDTLLDHLDWKGSVQRMPLPSLHPEDISEARPESNTPYRAWTESEKCRMHADWLIGINLSRMLTLTTNQSTPIPAGRVMTPMLALIRDRVATQIPKSESVITPFDTAHLQAACLRSAGTPPEKALMAAQNLYEAGLISYPFTNHRKLNPALWSAHHAFPVDLHQVESAVTAHVGGLQILDIPRRPLKPDEQTVFEAVLARESQLRQECPRQGCSRQTAHHPQGTHALAELYEDMADLRRWVVSPELRARAEDSVQLGTPRSRHAILAKVFEDGFVNPSSLRITQKGESALAHVPPSMLDPGTIILWESAISTVAQGSLDADAFMQRIQSYVGSLLQETQRRKAC
jgi:DNA topoisomerase-3